MATKAKKAVDRLVEKAYYRVASGCMIPMQEIPAIFKTGHAAIANGEDLDAAILAHVNRIKGGST